MRKIISLIIFFFIYLSGFSQMPWFYGYIEKPYIEITVKEIVIETNDTIVEINVLDPQRSCLISTFNSQIGVREKGTNSGKEVEMYLASAGLGKGNPWCASFVQWSFLQCTDIKINAAGWVPSWFPKKKLIYKRGEIDYIKKPQSGDLIGIWYSSKGRLAHIGFYEKEEGDFTISVEGNTNEEGSREGDGVYRKRRITRTIHSISSWLP